MQFYKEFISPTLFNECLVLVKQDWQVWIHWYYHKIWSGWQLLAVEDLGQTEWGCGMVIGGFLRDPPPHVYHLSNTKDSGRHVCLNLYLMVILVSFVYWYVINLFHKIYAITYEELPGMFCFVWFSLDIILFIFFFAYTTWHFNHNWMCGYNLPETLIHSSAYSKTAVLDKLLQSGYFFLLLYLNDIITILPINCHIEVCNIYLKKVAENGTKSCYFFA